MKPLVSVCIPVWNSEQYLDDCLESVFAQDFAGFEVVVVNDSSPGSDSSGRTCRQIVKQAHKRHKKSGCLKVSYIEHSENRGLVECRRTLINVAHGTFILMLDSDDVLKSGAISALWMLQEQHGTDIVAGGFDIFPQEKDSRRFPLYDGFIPGSELFSVWLIQKKYTSFLWAKLIRADVFRRAMEKIPYTYCNMAEDFLIWFFITQTAQSFFATSQIVYGYRRNSGMSSARKITTLEQCRQICSAASVFTNIFLYIDEQTQNSKPPLTDEQLYAIGRTAENYVKSNITQIKTLAVSELVPDAMQMLKEAWGEELVERMEKAR